MEKKIRKKYYSEEAVKKALQIDSFRNLSKEKVMEFTSMIPYMEKEVAMEVIKQFPIYVDFAKTVIEHYTQICETILATNKEEYEKNNLYSTVVHFGIRLISLFGLVS